MKVLAAILVSLMGAVTLAADFSVTSTDLKPPKPLDNKFVFNSFGCKGENVSPQLEWKNAPAGTKGFAVTVYDPDAPTGSGWWHWTVANIPASVTKLDEGASGNAAKMPKGAVEGRTDFGKPGYGGACPPPGSPHHYIFTVYALKTDKLEVGPESSGAMFGFSLAQSSLAKASLTVTYGR